MVALRAAVLCAACLFAAGCGGGPHRGEVSGTATFAGKPIPIGRIYFNPDFTKGNDGPQGYAEIHAGTYDTRKGGKGANGGPSIVVIQGFEAITAPDGNVTMGKPLFTEFRSTVDLPVEDAVRDFDVPASAAANLPKKPPRKI